MILEISNEDHYKLDKSLRNFSFDHNLCFSAGFVLHKYM